MMILHAWLPGDLFKNSAGFIMKNEEKSNIKQPACMQPLSEIRVNLF